MNKEFIITAGITVVLAVGGYLAKYFNDVKVMSRKEALDRVNRQLKDFYGPLLSLTSSSNAAWVEFRSNYRKNHLSYNDPNNPPTDNEKEIWRTWMTTVFIPINEKIYKIVMDNADLIIENNFPDVLKDLCAHVETYRPVILKWSKGDFSEHTALINYPLDLDKYAQKSFDSLKLLQQKLLK